MGLIKTGLVLAGGFGLIKAASKAANEHEDKKRQNPASQQGNSGYEPQSGYPYNQFPQADYNSNYHPQSNPRAIDYGTSHNHRGATTMSYSHPTKSQTPYVQALPPPPPPPPPPPYNQHPVFGQKQ